MGEIELVPSLDHLPMLYLHGVFDIYHGSKTDGEDIKYGKMRLG